VREGGAAHFLTVNCPEIGQGSLRTVRARKPFLARQRTGVKVPFMTASDENHRDRVRSFLLPGDAAETCREIRDFAY
jgi:hypothetical protein